MTVSLVHYLLSTLTRHIQLCGECKDHKMWDGFTIQCKIKGERKQFTTCNKIKYVKREAFLKNPKNGLITAKLRGLGGVIKILFSKSEVWYQRQCNGPNCKILVPK